MYISALILGYWRVKSEIAGWLNNPMSMFAEQKQRSRICKCLDVPRCSLGIFSQILFNLKWGESQWLSLVASCKHVYRYLNSWLINMSCLPLKMIQVSVNKAEAKIPTSCVVYSLESESCMHSRFPTNLLLNSKDWRCLDSKCKLFSSYLSLDRIDRS